jgi:hypothetical protein
MPLLFTEARDEVVKAFETAWQANAAAIVGFTPEVRYKDIQTRAPEPTGAYWVRVSLQSVDEVRTGVSSCPDENDQEQKRYTVSGLVFVQLFGPVNDDEAQLNLELLAVIARNAFRGKRRPGGLFFQNARINDLTPEDTKIRFNVVAEYQYDEIG